MIRTLIVDDESLARRRMRRMLSDFADVKVIGEAENGADAVERIEADKPELVLLDVQMPDLDGFGVLRMLETSLLPLVVFVTAFDQYAINAFDVNAIDYLLKPVKRERLEKAMAKAREKIASKETTSDHLVRLLQESVVKQVRRLQRLPVRSGNRILIIGIEQITSLRVDHGLVFVATAEGEFRTNYTNLGQIADQLDEEVFLRVHRQNIVNLNHIREVNAFDNSTARLTLSCGRQVSVSRTQMKRLRESLGL